MKTQNNSQKTVKSQVSRMAIRTAVIIFSIALISLTVSAQNFWQQFSTNGAAEKMALMSVAQPSETKNADAAFEAINAEVSTKLHLSSETFVCEPEMEKGLEVESWMTEETLFTSNIDFVAEEKEEALTIEDWMTNTTNFSNPTASETVDQEKPLEIEPWMTNEDNFGATAIITIEEPTLKIENWMTDNHFWGF